MNIIWGVIKGLLGSKKFVTAMIGVIVSICLYLFPDLPEDAITAVVSVIISYIVAQGLADFGKEAKKL
jgi:hypothetical protein